MIVRVAPPEHYAWIAERARLAVGADFQAIEAHYKGEPVPEA